MMVLIMNGPWQEGVEGVSKKFGFVLSADPARNFRSFLIIVCEADLHILMLYVRPSVTLVQKNVNLALTNYFTLTY